MLPAFILTSPNRWISICWSRRCEACLRKNPNYFSARPAGELMKLSRLMRYPIDIISVAVVVCTLSLQLLALYRHWPWYLVILILPLVRSVNLIEHNHMHLSIFRNAALNAFLGWLCHLSGGVPFDSYK